MAETIIDWAKNSFIHDQNLVREMFFLIYRQYNALGELTECLNKTYVIAETSIQNVKCLLHIKHIIFNITANNNHTIYNTTTNNYNFVIKINNHF